MYNQLQIGGNINKIYKSIQLKNVETVLNYKFDKNNFIFDPSYPIEKNLLFRQLYDSNENNKKFIQTEQSIALFELLMVSTSRISYTIPEFNNDKKLTINLLSFVALQFYEALYFYKLLKPDDKILLICKNSHVIETLIYYQKYVNFNFLSNNFNVILHNYRNEFDNNKTNKILKDNNITHIIKNKPFNNNTINELDNQIPKIEFAFIDFNTFTRDQIKYRQGKSFQSVYSMIIFTLKKLLISGNMILNIPEMTNTLMFNFLLYLSKYFDLVEIFEPIATYVYGIHYNIIIFKGYNGKTEFDELLKLNQKLYEYDPTGNNYIIKNKEEEKLIGYVRKDIITTEPSHYITQIVEADKDKKIYNEYCKFMENIYNDKLKLLYDVFYFIENKDKLAERMKENQIYAISYMKQIGLKIPEWIDENGLHNFFVHDVIRTILYTTKPFLSEMTYFHENINITLSDKIKYNNTEHSRNLYILSESIYQYTENINKQAYKNVELFINSYQKRLQRFFT